MLLASLLNSFLADCCHNIPNIFLSKTITGVALSFPITTKLKTSMFHIGVPRVHFPTVATDSSFLANADSHKRLTVMI